MLVTSLNGHTIGHMIGHMLGHMVNCTPAAHTDNTLHTSLLRRLVALTVDAVTCAVAAQPQMPGHIRAAAAPVSYMFATTRVALTHRGGTGYLHYRGG